MTHYGTNFNEHAPLIQAVVFSPNANRGYNLNCGVIVIATVGDSLFLAQESFYQYGGYRCLAGVQFDSFFNEQEGLLSYWVQKAEQAKGAEWINLNEAREKGIKRAVQILETGYSPWFDRVKVDSQCLVRFDAIRGYINFYTGEVERCFESRGDMSLSLLLKAESKTSMSFSNCLKGVAPTIDAVHSFEGGSVYCPSYDWNEFRHVVAELPVMPFKYRIGHRVKEGRTMLVRQLNEALQDTGPYTSVYNSKKDANYRARDVSAMVQSLFKWNTIQDGNKGVIKAIRRAVKAGVASTAGARRWFKKFHAISLLGGWARREEKARKQSTNKEAIS